MRTLRPVIANRALTPEVTQVGMKEVGPRVIPEVLGITAVPHRVTPEVREVPQVAELQAAAAVEVVAVVEAEGVVEVVGINL